MKLYVGNLPANTSAKDLEDLFTPYGDVTSARVLTSQHGGHPRGYGYVEMMKPNFMVVRVSEARS
jgi:RNA recognition motif-containing protein